MKFALVDDIRQEAMLGQKGLCPVCGAQCISKCGERKINHWAHKSKKDCDPWWEKETFWHRNWKDKFPKEWQEVINYDSVTGEKHIADIKTDTGLVIEFQHSSITPQERKSREDFHKAMVWVANIVNKRDVKLFEEYPNKTEGVFRKSEVDIPTRWFGSKVPVLFDLSDPELGRKTDFLYCMLPQTMGNWYKMFHIISKQDFIDRANNGSLKQYLHDLMVVWQQEIKRQKHYDSLCEEVSKNMELLRDYADNFKGATKNWKIKTIKNTKGWKKIGDQWYIPSGNNAFLLVDREQGCEFEQRFPICNENVKNLSDYYNNITDSKCLMYEGCSYNGELCAGHAMAKYFDKDEGVLYIICKESKGAFVKKRYRRDYGFYNGSAGFEWLQCPMVPYSYNLIIVTEKGGKFVHEHRFELENWLMAGSYEVLP